MRDATLEYRLSIYHARASDSGLYTCNTPNNKSHSVNIIVADVRLVLMSHTCIVMILMMLQVSSPQAVPGPGGLLQ